MNRFAITHYDSKTGLRQLTFANQGRNFYASRQEGEKAMEAYRAELFAKILGKDANTLEVREVDCYDNGDAKGIYFPVRLRPVTGKAFSVFCFACGERFNAGDPLPAGYSKVYADQTGTAFKAYYCEPCARPALELQDIEEKIAR